MIICQEILHSIQQKRGSTRVMILKLDLDKAYDRPACSFISETLKYVRLPCMLVDIIMRCVSMGVCRLLWKGEVTDLFLSFGGSSMVIHSLRISSSSLHGEIHALE